MILSDVTSAGWLSFRIWARGLKGCDLQMRQSGTDCPNLPRWKCIACRYSWPLIKEFRDEAKEEHMPKLKEFAAIRMRSEKVAKIFKFAGFIQSTTIFRLMIVMKGLGTA